ncbi:MAG: right-handed parallel beta-helix repeat-containing protein [Thermoplasmatota archaeon]
MLAPRSGAWAALVLLVLVGLPSAPAATPHAPIVITSDADLAAQAALEGWPGSGVPADPYIIEGYDITAGSGGTGISVTGTVSSLLIRLNHIHDGQTGIHLASTHNVTIQHNRFALLHQCIEAETSIDLHIIRNDFASCAFGIVGDDLVDLEVRHNFIRRTVFSAQIIDLDGWHVHHNTILNGAFLMDRCLEGVFEHNILRAEVGMRGCGDAEISNNTIRGAVRASQPDVLLIEHNTIDSNRSARVEPFQYGIWIDSAPERAVLVQHNTVRDHEVGVFIAGISGIFVQFLIADNQILDNDVGYLTYAAGDHVVTRNHFLGNIDGMRLGCSAQGIIYDNVFDNHLRDAFSERECDLGAVLDMLRETFPSLERLPFQPTGGAHPLPHDWYVEPQPGPNVLGGPQIGGNFWSRHDHTDRDSDGFADSPYGPVVRDGQGRLYNSEVLDRYPLAPWP